MHGHLTAIAVLASLGSAACGPAEPPKPATPVVEIAAAPSASPNAAEEPPPAEDKPRQEVASAPGPKKPTPKEQPTKAPPAATASATSPANTAQIQQARQLFKEGVEHVSNGRYADGRDAFLAAYQLVPNPKVLYNAAMAADLAGDIKGACSLLHRWIQDANPSPAELANVPPRLTQRCP